MKSIKSLVLLTLALFSLGAQAEFKAAFINSAEILQKAPQAKAAIEQMKKEFQGREQSLKSLAQEIQKQEESLQKDGAIMSADQKKKLEGEILEKKRKLRFDADSLKEDVELRRNQEIQKVRTAITQVIYAYGKDHGFDMIFSEGVAYADDKVNITDEILNELSKK